ncbi:MAG: hypothetical protein JRN39_02695 [Nitrososphaerota archaeon]|nr:hypothetical protein [Nitrososphaerota archaeon]
MMPGGGRETVARPPTLAKLTPTRLDTSRGEPANRGPEFYDILQSCVHDGLKNVLGEIGMNVVLFHLKLDGLVREPKEFHERLRSVFKEGGLTLEKVIAKDLYRRLGLSYEEGKTFDFEGWVARAMREASAGGR